MNAPTPGWNPDPSGRHEYRYWDGSSWTDDVSDNGVTSVDPVAGADPGAATGLTDPAPAAPVDPTQVYGQQPPPGDYGQAGPPPGGYPPAGPGGPGYPPGPGDPGGYDPYGTGGYPPATPPKKGVPTGLIIGGAVLAILIIIGLVVVLTSGGDDDTATDDTTTTTAGDDTTTTEDDESTATTAPEGPETSDVFALGVGDCVTDDTEMTGTVTDVGIIGCDQPHSLEVYHSFQMTDDALPDEDGITTIVQDECLPAFQSFVGLDYPSSVLEVNYLSPTADSWDAGDRELLCLVFDPSGDVTGTLAGANR